MNLWVKRMKVIEIFGENRADKITQTIEGCRGIIIRGGKILLSYQRNIDQYMIPGGGLEVGESLRECAEREIAEECGVRADAHTHFLRLEEYYRDTFFKSNYFICGYEGECPCALTETEIAEGLVPVWVELNEAVRIFGDYESFRESHPMRYGMYYREHLALAEFLRWDKEQ